MGNRYIYLYTPYMMARKGGRFTTYLSKAWDYIVDPLAMAGTRNQKGAKKRPWSRWKRPWMPAPVKA